MLSKQYIALVLVRAILAWCSPGYIHPDEHFQSGEIAASLIFEYGGTRPLRTWEWDSTSPARSVVSIAGSLGAFRALKWLRYAPTGHDLFRAQRMLFFTLSLGLDYAVARLSDNPKTALLLLASSPVALVFLVRPFSNSTEAVLLALALVALANARKTGTRKDLVFLGAALAVGFWVRFTFVAFVAPIAVFLAISGLRTGTSLKVAARLVIPTGLAFAATAALVTLLDTAFFNSLSSLPLLHGPLRLTPLNALMYNMSSKNLAEHGTHPRWLHAVVNMPMVFGPGVVAAGWTAWRELKGMGSALRSDSNSLSTVLLTSIGGALAILSIPPHQEPRFLLPLVTPIVLLSARFLSRPISKRTRAAFWITWTVHFLGLVAFFGFLHQGGVVPASLALNKAFQSDQFGSQPAQIVFWRTFMPPRHLIVSPDSSQVAAVIDLSGAPVTNLCNVLNNLLRDSPSHTVLLVAPVYAIEGNSLLSSCLLPNPIERLSLGGKDGWWHLNPDHLDELESWRDAKVSTWRAQ